MANKNIGLELMENYPEAGSYNCLKCIGWDYEHHIYTFYDDEESKRYVIGKKEIKKGFELLAKDLLAGKLPGLSVKSVYDPCDYDAYAIDAMVQMAIFGEIIYG